MADKTPTPTPTPPAAPKPAAKPSASHKRPTSDELAFGLDETIAALIGNLAPEGQAIYTPRAMAVKSNAERFDLMYRLQLYTIGRIAVAITQAAVEAKKIWYAQAYESRFITPKEGKTTGWLAHIQNQLERQLSLSGKAGVIASDFPPDGGQKLIYLGRPEAEDLERAIVNGEGLYDALKNPRAFERQKVVRPHTWGSDTPRVTGKTARERASGKTARTARNRADRAGSAPRKGGEGKKKK